MTTAATTEVTPEPVSPVMPTYIVSAPCVIVRGERGSRGTYYEGEMVRPWSRPDGDDMATADVLAQLAADGFLTAIGD